MTIRRAAVLLVIVSMLASLPVVTTPAPGTAASASACRVKNLDTNVTKYSLQESVTLARSGHRLTGRGTGHGITYIGKSLRIRGVHSKTSGRPTLDADRRGSVLTIQKGASVVIKDLRIRDGKAASGGGVLNLGALVLEGSTAVRGNTATGNGGGVMNHGTLRLKDFAVVSGNIASNGGGAGNAYTGTLVLNDSSSIHGNTASSQMGGGVDNDGILTLNDLSSIHYNVAKQAGGVFNIGTITLNDSSSIHHNTASSENGGGVSNYAHLTLNGSSSISVNEASRDGGGVRNYAYLTLNDSSSIHHNTSGYDGGGVWNGGPLTLNDSSSIHHNAAAWSGGGYHDRYSYVVGDICGPPGNVHGNSPDDCSP
jgi:hypothetical protein